MAVFQKTCQDFPRSANARDSLAEAFAKTGDTVGAAENHAAALAIDPGYPNAVPPRARGGAGRNADPELRRAPRRTLEAR